MLRRKPNLTTVKGFRQSAVGFRFDASYSHDRLERFAHEPRFFLLRREVTHQQIDFLLSEFGRQGDKNIGIAQVSLILRDFVLKYQMLAKRIPGYF